MQPDAGSMQTRSATVLLAVLAYDVQTSARAPVPAVRRSAALRWKVASGKFHEVLPLPGRKQTLT